MDDRASSAEKKVTFIQYEVPPLRAGRYTLTVEQQLNTEAPHSFSSTSTLIVKGERFSFDAHDINSVFPPHLANGEFDGVLPHVVFNRRTLPWERSSDSESEASCWLAVLLFNDDEAPTLAQATAKDLIQQGQTITVQDSTITGTGRLPSGYLSYPNSNPLEFSESPDARCTIIDIPAEVFSRIAPGKHDLPYLAHIREVDSADAHDGTSERVQYAVVLGNRVARPNAVSHAFLVSLEGFANYLPNDDGTPSSQIPAGTTCIRLITYTSWRYTANTLDETFQALLENLNTAHGHREPTTVRFPFQGTAPTADQVETALSHQASGQLSENDGQVLVENALMMGYVPLNHHLRHGGQTVSWYRGPFVPYPVSTTIKTPLSCPDAANTYNPQTGLFDVSYGAAWQLGQLLALQNSGFATALSNWKKTVHQQEVMAAEARMLDAKLEGLPVFTSLLHMRRTRLNFLSAAAPTPPETVITWLSRLRLLYGVPFNYLLPDEHMLPPESLRFFYLDWNWIEALLDGAFSIGRGTTRQLAADARSMHTMRGLTVAHTRNIRRNRHRLTTYVNTTEQVAGFLLRSKVVAGWTNLQVNGYADTQGNSEIQKLRLTRLSNDVMVCLFDGVVKMVAIHEPPEQLHAGVEGHPGLYTTTLRAVTGNTPGQQLDGRANIPTRSDQQTLQINTAQANIKTALNNPPLSQNISTFTSAEFALEMIKGVVTVEFQNTTETSLLEKALEL